MISQEQNVSNNSCNFDVNSALCLIPVFNERALDTFFFTLFERVVDLRGWQDAERTLLLQYVLTRKAQSAYSVLDFEESRVYEKVKDTILTA